MFRETPESPRMFESDLVDFFSRIHPAVVPVIFLPVVTGLAAWSVTRAGVAWPLALAQVAAGFAVWTFTEYWLHRTLFHWQPDTSWGPRMHYLIHGVHHDWFRDRLRLVMPPAVSLTLGFAFFGLYWAIAQGLAPWLAPTWVFAFMAGKVLGYVNYDMTHYYIHHHRPVLGFHKALRKHHNSHHHADHDRKFGVSFQLWDRVFGTM